ncbi:MAG: MFS transporter [Gemmatimonadaceae bacterium]
MNATRTLHGNDAVPRAPTLGLRENWRQFALLMLVNAFVGGMVGLERTVLPLIAGREFGLASTRAALAFIATFGIVKALTNFIAGYLGDRFGRKRVLVAGWLVGLPVPLLVMWAPSWNWVIAANVLLGINQGLTWSTTVIMKIDIVGPDRRGLAMGLNEFAGYLAVALAALASGFIAERFGLRPEPFYLGIAFAALGLALSLFFVRDTTAHARHEVTLHTSVRDSPSTLSEETPVAPGVRQLFVRTSWKDPALVGANQAGLVNNLNDGLAWGLLPIFFAAAGLSVGQVGTLAFIYPGTWGIVQLWTGTLSDRIGRKWLIAGGMLLQGLALGGTALARGFLPWLFFGVLLGLGTAMVYPTLLAAVGDVAHPSWRSSAVGVYRFWRDMGYAFGAILAGSLADALGMPIAIGAIAAVTAASGLLVALRMPETAPGQLAMRKLTEQGMPRPSPHVANQRSRL